MILACTGHRPSKLGAFSPQIYSLLKKFSGMVLAANGPDKVITGMALGFDQAVAEASIALDIPFVAAVPFKGQHLRWPAADQARYFDILDHAAEIVTVSQEGFSPQAMQFRNQYMVDHCDLLVALWDTSKTGGTKNCVDYARNRVKWVNVWEDWLDYRNRHYVPCAVSGKESIKA